MLRRRVILILSHHTIQTLISDTLVYLLQKSLSFICNLGISRDMYVSSTINTASYTIRISDTYSQPKRLRYHNGDT